ncbi:MAG: glutamate racemase [Spirochaetaceae bacterium]|jgi:glutamate racemase|nr:glutamate racemase [Spirochaetaceae bacterium]
MMMKENLENRIVFWDSGAGGLPYADYFRKRNPDVPLLYLADNLNFPYGPKSKDELIACTVPLAEKLIKTYKPSLIVLVCNTLSVSALQVFRDTFPGTEFVGTVPAIKPAALASKTGRIGIIGTERTVSDSYTTDLLHSAQSACILVNVAAPDLVAFAEINFALLEKDEFETQGAFLIKPYIETLRTEKVDSLVLGCTHFLHLKEAFVKLATPDISIFDSVDGVARRIEELIKREAPNTQSLFTGKLCEQILLLSNNDVSDLIWQKRAEEYGFKIAGFGN